MEDLERDLFCVRGQLVQLWVRGFRHLAKDLGARVVSPVYAVAEAGEARVLGMRVGEPPIDVFDRPDRVEHGSRRVGRAAVRGTLERRDRADHARREVAPGRSDDARGERRSV